uniref:Uncharacterized protein n=1 Tax=Parascaris equorum TaxID=6256 RepID=A0A914RC93_PAREQ
MTAFEKEMYFRIEPACVGTEMNGSVDLTPTPATEIPLGVPLAQPPRPPPPAAMIAAYSRYRSLSFK